MREMLQNRSFEDDRGDRDQKPTKIPGWRWSRPRGPRPRSASTVRTAQSVIPLRLRLDIVKAGQFQAGVANDGFNGLR